MNFFEITDRKYLLAKYESDWPRLRGMIEALPPGAVDFVPDLQEAWSIREHLAHLMDVEIRAFIRYRNAVVDPGIDLRLGGGEVDASNILLRYSSQNIDDALEIIRLLRSVTLRHVETMTDEEMTTYGIQHPDFGRINLRMILSIYTQHFDKHMEYINRNMDFLKRKGA
jgi:hypothetical protein